MDGSGQIDKFEFQEIAAEIRADNRRRTLLAMGLAAASATVVSRYSEEYQWLQKTFRGVYLESGAEAAQRQLFPTAMLSGDVDEALARALDPRGFTPSNTLFAHSVCSDEVNNRDEELIALMVSRWQEGFSLGGLGGLPFAGKSGFRAFLHHVPDSGKLLVLFAPHVGIDASGRVGALQRNGQVEVSKACGAGIGAYKAIVSKRGAAPQPLKAQAASVLEAEDKGTDPFDPQLGTIIELLTPRLAGIEDAKDPIAFVTYQMYAIVRELVDSCIAGTDDVWDWATEVAVCGGIMVNRRVGGDFFQPLSFEVRRASGTETVDVFAETFGARPNLEGVLGSKEAVQKLYQPAKGRKPSL